MTSAQRALLVILDGWGHGPKAEASAIAQANTPFVDSLYERYPHAELVTFGEAVGLPEGQMGNSEVGHLNIGAGRVVYQELARINKAVREGDFFQNPTLKAAFDYAKTRNKALHLIGLVSDGGVHSHSRHLMALCDMAKAEGLQRAYVHAFTDGRDTDPKSGLGFIEALEAHIAGGPVRIASVVGRYYAMDRDKRWERVKMAYDLLVHGQGEHVASAAAGIAAAYADGITDEFVRPLAIAGADGQPLAKIEAGDAVIFFNFRTDRPRELTTVLTQKDMPEHDMLTLPLHFVTMTRYDETYKGLHVVYEKDELVNTLGEVLSAAGKTQVRIAETEKYPHVTFFFSGGKEAELPGERRILVPSPKVATYDLQPEMSAIPLTEAIVADIEAHRPDFICLNYANADMVGHTGVFEAAMSAAETVDKCLQRLVETALRHHYAIVIIADHGNSDYMINEDGSPNTAHTTNPVPIFFLHEGDTRQVRPGKLADIAPSILSVLGMAIPAEMDGDLIIGHF